MKTVAVAELLSEHCCTGECSTSHVVSVWGLGAAPADRRLLAATPATHPTTAHHGSIRCPTGRQFSSSTGFSRRSRVQEKLRQILLQRFPATRPRSNGSILRKVPKRAADS